MIIWFEKKNCPPSSSSRFILAEYCGAPTGCSSTSCPPNVNNLKHVLIYLFVSALQLSLSLSLSVSLSWLEPCIRAQSWGYIYSLII